MIFIESLSALVETLGLIKSFSKSIKNWWNIKRPSRKLLEDFLNDNAKICIFVRDFFIQSGTPLYSQEGLHGPIGIVPNVHDLWPRVEGIGLSKILNSLGQVDKTKNIEIIEMGKDSGIWDKNIIILGAQTQKCFDFYKKMQEVAYEVTATNIKKKSTGKIINFDPGYGYGIILKCKNPFVKEGKGKAFLVGGFGVLGTEAATNYFANNFATLGKQFGTSSFGVVVRASITAGAQSTEKIKKYDYKFE